MMGLAGALKFVRTITLRAHEHENEMPRDKERDALNEFASELYKELMEDFRQSFVKEGVFESAGLSQIASQCVYLAAMMRVTAMVAVDVGMESERFLAIAAENHQEAARTAETAGPAVRPD
jgi:hypothetical protein